jgi:hypothetical protein
MEERAISAQSDLQDSRSKAFQLKGFDVPVELYTA